ncbi:MAG: monofunctional biosynthetic peptidoglycan transglycosylase [Vicinamibacteria bacterium]|nr:monofunctional biosynthetic peptidoglycan transglycosylase [Vicinamibacteria bacterium]
MRTLIAISTVALLAYGIHVFVGMPRRADVRRLSLRNPSETSVMRQRADEARRSGRQPRCVKRWAPLSRVSRHLIRAVIVAEDPNFFGHEGIDWGAVRESIETNVKKRRFARGASTITQQLAKNLFFTTRKSVTRKLRELVAARWIEQDLSKLRIIELYLNVIEWGDGLYGCEAAARRYYGKSAARLSEAEAAGLAAMIPSPRRINPRDNPTRHARSQRRILRLMARFGFVKRQVGRIGAPPVEAKPATPSPEPQPPPSTPSRDVE